MYYLCTYDLYCALEEPADLCCACGSCEDTASAESEEDETDDSLVSDVELSVERPRILS